MEFFFIGEQDGEENKYKRIWNPGVILIFSATRRIVSLEGFAIGLAHHFFQTALGMMQNPC